MDGQTLIKRGPFKPSANCGAGFHKCEESPLHLQADLCASCHQVYHHDTHFPSKPPISNGSTALCPEGDPLSRLSYGGY